MESPNLVIKKRTRQYRLLIIMGFVRGEEEISLPYIMNSEQRNRTQNPKRPAVETIKSIHQWRIPLIALWPSNLLIGTTRVRGPD